ncbi:hypothetical protein GK047_08680 [Paenibacillus sp. SYP-B3998]|uniref:Uncharacterized protein n=1 Tax=Paenibacillus sp. SYP-B3998 TaxID=2678564 RepID=A0A6G3ZV47_9BACL|nr:hypothetical protein [Paenibacillus sp. SYP-B3998]NEW06083.1 hypothetical protein [Paenibacillus sp. SYP-B3998]
MKWSVRMMITAGLSIAVAVCLSLLPKLDHSVGTSLLDTWSSKRTAQLTDRNLVDLLVQVPIQLRIRKVELTNSRLSLDLSLPKNADSAAVYRDLYTIAQIMTSKTNNVNQVWVRILDYSGAKDQSSAQLVLAMVADREHGKDMETSANGLSLIQLEQQLQNRFHITYTSRWQQRYPL